MRLARLALLLVVGFLGSCGAIQFALHKVLVQRKPVGAMIPPEFPIVVVTRGEKDGEVQAQIIYFKNLREFTEKNPQYSYLVPPREEERLRRELSRSSVVGSGDFDQPAGEARPWQASFKVAPLPNGRQAFAVVYDPYDDLTTKSWYEATDKEIFPQYHYQYAEVGGMFIGGAAIFLTVVLWVAGFIVYFTFKIVKHWRKRRQAQPSPT